MAPTCGRLDPVATHVLFSDSKHPQLRCDVGCLMRRCSVMCVFDCVEMRDCPISLYKRRLHLVELTSHVCFGSCSLDCQAISRAAKLLELPIVEPFSILIKKFAQKMWSMGSVQNQVQPCMSGFARPCSLDAVVSLRRDHVL